MDLACPTENDMEKVDERIIFQMMFRVILNYYSVLDNSRSKSMPRERILVLEDHDNSGILVTLITYQ